MSHLLIWLSGLLVGRATAAFWDSSDPRVIVAYATLGMLALTAGALWAARRRKPIILQGELPNLVQRHRRHGVTTWSV